MKQNKGDIVMAHHNLPPHRSVSIAEIPWSLRTENVLYAEGIATLCELSQKTSQQLLEIRNFGRKSLREVCDVLAEHGLSLRKE